MASGIARGRVRTTTTAVESRKMAAIQPCFTLYFFDVYDIMLWSIDTCQIRLSADQYHVTILRAQVYALSRSRVLFKFIADQVLVLSYF